MLNNVSAKKTFTHYSQHRRAPIEYYLQKISLIKNDPSQMITYYKEPRMNTRNDFATSFYDLKKHQLSLQQKKKNYQKKRSLSTKTEIEFHPHQNVCKTNAKTQYGEKQFQSTQINLFSKISGSEQRSKLRTISNFKAKIQKGKDFSQGKRYLSLNKIHTQPYENKSHQRIQQRMTTELDHQEMTKIATEYHQQMSTIREQVDQNFETAKRTIFEKISSYVKSLDEKGQQELNHMLTGNYKRHIKCHSDVILYEEKIGRMIKTNKQIVKMLREEFLSLKKMQQLSQRSVFGNENLDNVSSAKRIMNDEIQINLQLSHQPKLKSFISNNSTKPLPMEASQSLTQHPKQDLQQSKSQIPQDYNQQMKHVTNQFVNEWEKSKLHKKKVYQKFRKTLFKKFPHYKQRQQKRNQKLGIKTNQNQETFSDFSDDDENNDIFNSKIHQNVSKEMQTKNNQRNASQKNQQKKIEDQNASTKNRQSFAYSQQKQVQMLKNSSKNQRDQVLPLKQTTSELSKSISKITLLSKKNSLSKGSGRTLSIFTAEDKKQIERFNFTSLVEFIFKRAFFYSVSKKRVIINKTEMTPLEIVSPTQERKPDFSFIKYNSKTQQKKHLRASKLNEKKLRATGNFLIKNKYSIMEMQQQGKKSYDFLRRCIEDAIQDYVKGTKKK